MGPLDDYVTRIIPYIPPGRLEVLRAEFRATGGDPDSSGFVDWLRDREILDGATYAAIVTPKTVAIDTTGADAGTPLQGIRTTYEPRGTLGQGAMGEVRAALDPALMRLVAYKTLRDHLSGDFILRRFVTEARITAQLDHPAIVPVYALERDAYDRPAYAMKLVVGETLRLLIDEAKTRAAAKNLDPRHRLSSRLEVFLKICDAIHYAHSKGVIHRDLKPSNIMVGRYHEVYVMDWGVAKVLGIEEDLPTLPMSEPSQPPRETVQVGVPTPDEATRDGHIVGTLPYMSPEQASAGILEVGPATDQFALAILLYELTTLRHPYMGDLTTMAPERLKHFAIAASFLPYDPVRAGEPVPAALQAVIQRASALDPNHRYPTVGDLAEDVRRVLRDEAPVAMPDNTVRAGLRWLRKHAAPVAGVLLLLLTGSLIVGAWLGERQRSAAAAEKAAFQEHTRALAEVFGATMARTNLADAAFVFYEGQVTGLATAAAHAILHGAEEEGPALHRDAWLDPATAPAGMIEAKNYPFPISLDHETFIEAPGTPRAEWEPLVRRLQPLHHMLHETYLERFIGPISLEEVMTVPLPVRWVYVGTENPSVGLIYPGASMGHGEFDSRTRPWYRSVIGQRGSKWGEPYRDEMTGGYMLPCSRAMYAEDGTLVGVVGMDLAVEFIISDWLERAHPGPGEVAPIPGYHETLLIDRDGQVVIQSGEGTSWHASAQEHRGPEAFAPAEVVAAMKERPVGILEHGTDAWAWGRMMHLGWTMLVRADLREPLR